jgi:hypothetical protein
MTIPVVLPEAYRDKTAWMATYMAGVLKVSNMICVIFFSVGLGVEGGFCQEDRVLLRGNSELVVEGMMPDLLHVIPVGNDTVLNGVFQGQNTSLGLGFISDIRILLSHSDHDSGMSGASHDGGEHSSGSIISSKAGFAHS